MFDIKEYNEATSIEQAKQFLKKYPNSKLIAGGSDLLIEMRAGHMPDAYLLGITRIGLDKITLDKNENIHIGPTCTFTNIENHEIIKERIPYLGQAVGTVGGPQLRNIATIGGNICNGATSADSAPILFCLDAKLKIESLEQTKIVRIQEFYLGPGKVILQQGEILTDIIIEKELYDGYLGKYEKFAQRNAMDIATIGNAVLVKCEDGMIIDAKIACGVAAPMPVRCTIAEQDIIGKSATAENIDHAANLTISNTKARDSWRGSKAFREHLVVELTKRSLLDLCGIKQ